MDHLNHTNKLTEEANTEDWLLSFPRKDIDTQVLCRLTSPLGAYGIIIRSDRTKVHENKTESYTVELYKYATNEYGDRVGERQMFQSTHDSIDDAISTMEDQVSQNGIR